MSHSMAKSNQTTKGKLLLAAAELFARKGYRETTVQDICSFAEANVAAVSYHFGSKEHLYLAVWEQLFEEARELFQPSPPTGATPWEELAEYVRRRVTYAFFDENYGLLRLVIHHEMTNPTAVHERVFGRFISPAIEHLGGLVAAVMAVPADSMPARRCTFLVHSQIVLISMAKIKKHPLRFLFDGCQPDEAEVDALAEQVLCFVRGGLCAAREQVKGEEEA